MGYSPEVVKKVREEFENKRQKAVQLSTEHSRTVYEKCPVIAAIDETLSRTGISVYKAAVEGGNLDEKIAALKKQNRELQESKREMLKQSGFPEDYTDIKYECNECNDTGYVGINMCSCMKKALVREAYNSSGLGKVLHTQTFDNFSLEYYSDKSEGGTVSPRDTMRNILEKSKQYVLDFGTAGKESNLLFAGTTGLGKTHLTTAIAKGVIDKGYDVVYDSILNIIRSFEQQRFDRDEYASSDVERYFSCDLLIIDDLGTEFKNTFTNSVLYNLLNTRINSGKSMIVSTNITDMPAFYNAYDERITSRLVGSFKLFKFAGQDIRIAKAVQSKNK